MSVTARTETEGRSGPRAVRATVQGRTEHVALVAEFPASQSAVLHRAEALDRRLRTVLSAPHPDPEEMFGDELRLAFRCLSRSADVPTSWAAASVSTDQLRSLLLRPAVEPIIYSYHGVRADDSAVLSDLASALAGRRVAMRTEGRCAVRAVRGCQFSDTPPMNVGRWLELRATQARRPGELGVLWAAERFAGFIARRPFENGNGRAGRALLSLDLMASYEAGGFSPLPLSVPHMLHSHEANAAFQLLERTGDAVPALSFALSMIERALDGYELLRGEVV